MHAWQFAKALYLGGPAGLDPLCSTMQNYVNLLYREEEREMLPLCKAEGIGVIPWSPMARGRLTRDWSEETERLRTDEFGKTLYAATEEADRRIVDKVGLIAKSRGVPRAQVALAWVLGKPEITSPIIGATKPHHLDDAVAALSLKLTGEEGDEPRRAVRTPCDDRLRLARNRGTSTMVNERTALIVGATRGLGLGLVREYVERGWRVVATSRGRNDDALDALAKASGSRLSVVQLDVTDPAAIDTLQRDLAGSDLDLLFVSAGIMDASGDRIADVSTESFSRVMLTNTLSPLKIVEALGGRVTPHGVIVAMTSVLGSVAQNTTGGYEVYRASKAALNTLPSLLRGRQQAALDRRHASRLGSHRHGRGQCGHRHRGERRRHGRRNCEPKRQDGLCLPRLQGPDDTLVRLRHPPAQRTSTAC